MNNFITNFKKSRTFVFLQRNSTEIFCAVCFLAVYLYLMTYMDPTNNPLKGHDYQFHYLRVESVKYNIENNNLFSGIDYLFFGGGGYAAFAYPDIFLFIPAVLRVLGLGIGDSMTIFIGLCNIFSYLFMFIFLKKISNSIICGTIGAVLYVLSNYRIDNIITRFALGEIQAYVFWPLILYGLYDFIFEDFKKPHIIGIGFIGMVLSHTISTAFALGLSVLLSVIFFKRIIKKPKKLIKLLITAASVAAVTAYYWIPLLELIFSCEMSVKEAAFHTYDSAISFTNLFHEIMKNGIAGMKFPIFLLCVPRVFLTRNSPVAKMYLQDEITKKRKNILVAADAFLIIGIVLSLMSTTLVPWDLLSIYFDFIQFPWRLFAPASLLLITAGTIYLYYTAEYTKAPKTAMVLVTAISILIAFIHADIAEVNHKDAYDDDYYASVSRTYTVGQGEWMPRAAKNGAKDALREMKDNVILSNNEWVPCTRENGSLEFELSNVSVDFARLPYVWYKGYSAKDSNGKELDVSMSDKGLVQLDLRGAVGTITVEHHPTALKIAGIFISLCSVIGLIILSILLSRKRKRH